MTSSNETGNVSIRAKFKKEEGFPYRLARNAYRGLNNFSLPVPGIVSGILWNTARLMVRSYYWGKSAFLVTPLYKGLCFKVGKDFKAGTFIPYVVGSGKIYIGDNVRLYGKQNFLFAAIREEIPEIHIGDNTTIGHNIVFDIAGKLIIGKQCQIASGVTFVDCGGHSIVPEKRAAGEPPTEKDVREITIGDNVWIGTGAYIFPGTIIGDNCVVSANTSVGRRIPPNSLVYASPAKVVRIRNISNII